ncbi:Glutamyl-tRNA(Gln) amidotransferase subunit A, chloroplastic/mitochondrial [Morella rubra]|uniref:Glutamyl-tRNA(Gln) amidotransferase subunit A, chloroplastic/mitochondrial n=1 Tax=Morella rubra TaxID=262757 RepID=A0A6A1VRJ1_9ROSI|nr:Glutamyl-tRNA(Gln) amidotransferase subunit A, chloroplastic/mitochondrial [Morella rubra]
MKFDASTESPSFAGDDIFESCQVVIRKGSSQYDNMIASNVASPLSFIQMTSTNGNIPFPVYTSIMKYIIGRLPALVLPCGFVEGGVAGLPVGLQMIGAAFDEVTRTTQRKLSATVEQVVTKKAKDSPAAAEKSTEVTIVATKASSVVTPTAKESTEATSSAVENSSEALLTSSRSFIELFVHPGWVSRYMLVSLMFRLFSGFSRPLSILSCRPGDLSLLDGLFSVGQRRFIILLLFIHNLLFFGYSGFGLFSSTATSILFLLFRLLLMDSLAMLRRWRTTLSVQRL